MTSGFAAVLVLAVALFAVSAGVAFYLYYGRLIMRSRVAGAPVSFQRMLRMTTSGLDAHAVVNAYLDARKAGVPATLDHLEAISKEKGDPRAAVKRLITAKHSGIHATAGELRPDTNTAN